MPTPDRPLADLATLDRHITDALAVLRVARAASRRSPNPTSILAEDDAESRLNGLLEVRQGAVRR